jgi:hypothetical protein
MFEREAPVAHEICGQSHSPFRWHRKRCQNEDHCFRASLFGSGNDGGYSTGLVPLQFVAQMPVCRPYGAAVVNGLPFSTTKVATILTGALSLLMPSCTLPGSM